MAVLIISPCLDFSVIIIQLPLSYEIYLLKIYNHAFKAPWIFIELHYLNFKSSMLTLQGASIFIYPPIWIICNRIKISWQSTTSSKSTTSSNVFTIVTTVPAATTVCKTSAPSTNLGSTASFILQIFPRCFNSYLGFVASLLRRQTIIPFTTVSLLVSPLNIIPLK